MKKRKLPFETTDKMIHQDSKSHKASDFLDKVEKHGKKVKTINKNVNENK